MEKSLPSETNNIAKNKLKLTEDASKIVQAIKKLHVPSTTLMEGSDVGNGSRKMKLPNGVLLTVKKNETPKDDAGPPCQETSNMGSVSGDSVTAVKENTVLSVKSENNVLENNGDKEAEEWHMVEDIPSNSTESSSSTKKCDSNSKECVKTKDDPQESPINLNEQNSTKQVTPVKCTSPVVFESTAKEEGMQKAVNKVVEKLLNELPASEDSTADDVTKFNGQDCRLYAELVKDANGSKRSISESDSGDMKVVKKLTDEANAHTELRMKIDLKRKQANYIDSDDKHVDLLTVKKVKIDSVRNEEDKKNGCLKPEAKVEEKLEITRISSKEIYALVEKLAKKLLTNRTSNEIGELKAKVQTLEKKVAYWKKQCWHLQKEVTECNIGVQRVNQNLKKNNSAPPVKAPSLPTRTMATTNLVPIAAAPAVAKKPELTTVVSSTAKIVTPIITAATVTPPKLPASVSILQAKSQNSITLPSNIFVTTTGANMIPKVASVVAPTTAVSTVRSTLDLQRKVQAAAGNPVPMRLVANQAVKQTNPVGPRPALTTVSPNAVKIIDLTADEDEANAKRVTRAFQFTATTAPQPITTMTPVKVTTAITNTRPITILAAPVTQATLGTNQIFLTTTPQPSLMRLPANMRTNNPTPNLLSPPINANKVAYLLPTSTVMSRPMLFAPANATQPILQPRIQTLLMQRGTTLVPVTTTAAAPQALKTVSIRHPLVTSGVSLVTNTLPVQGNMRIAAIAPTIVTTAAIVVPTTSTSTVTTTSAVTVNTKPEIANQAVVVSRVTPKHPAPLPVFPYSAESNSASLKQIPPKPALKISKVTNGIVLSWNMNLNTLHADIACYQLFAYQETNAPPSSSLWKKVGDVKALALPMACTLTQFVEGHKYHFAVRAMDVHKRAGPFSDAGSIVLPPTPASASSTTTPATRP